MPIIASAKSNRNFEPISEGAHIASCVSVIDLGEQYSEAYKKMQRRVMLIWEIPDETIEIDGAQKPRQISKEYTLSLGDKALLRAHLEAWRGKAFTESELEAFDLNNVLGKACQMQIVHTEYNGSRYANIRSIMSLPKGITPPKIESDFTYFALDEPASLSLMDKLPKWIQDKVAKSPTYRALVEAQSDPESGDFSPVDGDSTDLPF